jgi:hypothetical protein
MGVRQALDQENGFSGREILEERGGRGEQDGRRAFFPALSAAVYTFVQNRYKVSDVSAPMLVRRSGLARASALVARRVHPALPPVSCIA